MSIKIIRPLEWARPPAPARREVLHARPASDEGRAPILFVPGFGHGAWIFAEHWLEHAAERGYPASAMSLRGHGASGPGKGATLRAYAHDVTQVAASLPRQAVLVGHGAGALVVGYAMARYPARAGVLVSPVFGGFRALGAALARNPLGTLPALFGAGLGLRRGQLFSGELPAGIARGYLGRMGRASARAQWQLLVHRGPQEPVGLPRVLAVGSPDDGIVSRTSLGTVARRYGGAPLLFPGMGHDMMLEPRWREPIDAILDWLDKTV